MPTTTLVLVCHAKVPNRASWAGGYRAQAERLARADHPGRAVVGVSHGDLIPEILLDRSELKEPGR